MEVQNNSKPVQEQAPGSIQQSVPQPVLESIQEPEKPQDQPQPQQQQKSEMQIEGQSEPKAQLETQTANKTYDFEYNSFIAEDGNQVWAAALTLAWKEFLVHAKQENFNVQGAQRSQEIANNFTYTPFEKNDLDEKSYYIKCGQGQQTVHQINQQRTTKFPQCTLAPVKAEIGEKGIISYAYLFKKVVYPVKFERRQHSLYFKNTNKDKDNNNVEKAVPSFYTDDRNQEEQVLKCEFIDNQNFIVRIPGAEGNDLIYLYRENQNSSVKNVIQKIKTIQLNEKQFECIDESNQFEVPIVDLDYTREVTELIGAKLTNYDNRVIQSIMEGVKLKLDQSGARVQNDGVMFTNQCAIMNAEIYKFDGPFWIVMKEKDKHPYLCVKINNI